MADPYTNFSRGFHNHYPFASTPPPPPVATQSYSFITHCYTSSFLPRHPPSPPLREALPLLSLSPTRHLEKKEEEEEEEEEDTSCSASAEGTKNKAARIEDEADDEVDAVTVALHIGLPSPGAADLISRL
ncbi:hypothetical protein GW17_00028399, partial [Ensete ventricosum]